MNFFNVPLRLKLMVDSYFNSETSCLHSFGVRLVARTFKSTLLTRTLVSSIFKHIFIVNSVKKITPTKIRLRFIVNDNSKNGKRSIRNRRRASKNEQLYYSVVIQADAKNEPIGHQPPSLANLGLFVVV